MKRSYIEGVAVVFVLLMLLGTAFLVGSVVADDQYINLRDHLDQVKLNLGYAKNSSSLPDSIVVAHIRDAYLTLSTAVYGKYIADTIVDTQYRIDYSLDTNLIKVENVFWKKRDSIKVLKQSPVSAWEDIYSEPFTLQMRTDKPYEVRPSYYDWRDGYLFLYPVPYITGDTIIVFGYGKVNDLLAATDSTFPSQVPTVYRPAAVYYATAMTARYLDKHEEAEFWMKEYDRSVAVLNRTINQREYLLPNEK